MNDTVNTMLAKKAEGLALDGISHVMDSSNDKFSLLNAFSSLIVIEAIFRKLQWTSELRIFPDANAKLNDVAEISRLFTGSIGRSNLNRLTPDELNAVQNNLTDYFEKIIETIEQMTKS